MPIRFPDFKNTQCKGLFLCGSLQTDEQETIDFIDGLKDKVLISSYGRGNTKAFVRLDLGGTNPKHVHIDVLRSEVFGDAPPDTTIKFTEIETLLDKFAGMKISVKATGLFILPVKDLPEGGLIRRTFFGTEQGDLAIAVSEVEFTITGAPIQELTWYYNKDRTAIGIQIDACGDTEIGKDYLSKHLQLLDAGFKLFVLGESPDGA